MIEITEEDFTVKKDFIVLQDKKIENGFYLTIMKGGSHDQVPELINQILKWQEDSKKLENIKEFAEKEYSWLYHNWNKYSGEPNYQVFRQRELSFDRLEKILNEENEDSENKE